MKKLQKTDDNQVKNHLKFFLDHPKIWYYLKMSESELL
jgi:hypothetical protein